MQQFQQGERPIAFISRTLNSTEQNYSMWEKELFAVVWAIKYFRPYLLNHNFLVKSDNKPSTSATRQLSVEIVHFRNNRVIRWIYPFKDTASRSNTKLARRTLLQTLSAVSQRISMRCQTTTNSTVLSTQSAPVTNTEISRLFQEAYKRNPACSAI